MINNFEPHWAHVQKGSFVFTSYVVNDTILITKAIKQTYNYCYISMSVLCLHIIIILLYVNL